MTAPKPKSKSINGRQTKAITTLSKQVRSLQLSQFGNVQNNRLIAIFKSVNPTLSEGRFPAQSRPLAFLLQNFNNDQQIYSGTLAQIPGQGLQTAGYQLDTNFQICRQVQFLEPKFQWNRHNREQSTDIRVGYLPLTKYFTFRTEITPNPNMNLKPCRINIKLIRMRKSEYRTQTNTLTYNLPSALGAYSNLLERPVVQTETTRNYLNKDIHDVIYNKDVYITPQNQASFSSLSPNPVEPTVNSYCYTHRFKYDFKPKFLKTNVELPEEDPNAMWSHIPIPDQVWCLISCDAGDPYLQNLNAKMSITTLNYWRDNVGAEGV